MRKIHREFKYAPGEHDNRTTAVEAFEARQGVCQDFAHIMSPACAPGDWRRAT